MATKYIAAAAAVVALANTTEAMRRPLDRIQDSIIQDKMYRPQVQDKMYRPVIQDKMYRPHVQPRVHLFDEDEEQLITTGQVGDEKFNINLNHNSAIKDGRNWREELKKAEDLWNQARAAGFFDEEQLITTGQVGSEKFNINLNHNSAVKDGRNWKEELKKAQDLWKQAREAGFFEEDEEQLITTGHVGDEKFNINLNHNSAIKDGRNWKEELKKAEDLWNQARAAGFFDEDEEQFSLTSIPGRIGNSKVTIRVPNGDLVTGWESTNPNCVIMEWTNGLFCGNRVGYASYEEDEEQLITTGHVGDEKFNINLNHNSAIKDGGDWKAELKKAQDLWNQARAAGFFEEEEQAAPAEWKGIKGRKFNAKFDEKLPHVSHRKLLEKEAQLDRIRKIVKKSKE